MSLLGVQHFKHGNIVSELEAIVSANEVSQLLCSQSVASKAFISKEKVPSNAHIQVQPRFKATSKPSCRKRKVP